MKALPYIAAAGLAVLVLMLVQQSRWQSSQLDQHAAEQARSKFLTRWNQILDRERRNAVLTQSCRQSSDTADRLAYSRWLSIARTMNQIAGSTTNLPPDADVKITIAEIALREIQFPAYRVAEKPAFVTSAPEWVSAP